MEKNFYAHYSSLPVSSLRLLAPAVCTIMFFCYAGTGYGQAKVLLDINTQEDVYLNEYSSLTVGGNKVYFINNTNELWKTTGNEGGTVRIKPFVRINSTTNSGTGLFLSADDGTGTELWKSTGTFGTTVKLTDFAANGGGVPESLTDVNGTLYFVVYHTGYGRELWKSDGTPGGTVMVKDIRPGKASSTPAELINANGILFFTANDGKLGQELWKTDGTPVGTTMVKDVREGAYLGSAPGDLTNVNGMVFFSAADASGRELWRSNGTAETTIRLGDIRPGSASPYLDNLTGVDNKLFFTANDGVHGHELWTSDGTPQGTQLLKDMTPGREGSHGEQVFTHPMGNFTSVLGYLYFTAYEQDTYYIWKSDGTEAGTVPLRVASHGIGMPCPRFVPKGDDIYYFDSSEDEGSDYAFHLFRMERDGSDPVRVCTLTMEDFYSPYDPELVVLNNTLYFWGRNDSQGFKLFRSNGSPGSMVMIKDVMNPTISSSPYPMVKTANNQIFFVAEQELFSQSVWKTNGTAEGTVELKDVDYVNSLVATSTEAFFSTDYYLHVWKSDGTVEGTTLVKSDRASNSAQDMKVVNDLVYFHTYAGGLWRTDGTEAGTIQLTSHENIASKHAAGDVLLFHVDNGNNQTELWRSNGLAAGTYRIYTFARNQPSFFNPVAIWNDVMYFIGNDGVSGNEVWRTDGTTQGTFRVADLNTSDSQMSGPDEFDIRSMAMWNDMLYISALDNTGQWALYKSDGTPGNAVRITDMNPVSEMISTSDRLHLFVSATTDNWGLSNHWATDGTEAGAELMNDFLFPHDLEYVIHDNILYFGAYNSRDLWRSDGTVCGTFNIDMEVTVFNSFNNLGSLLVFNGSTPELGSEPFVFNLMQAPGSPCGPAMFTSATTLPASTEEVQHLLAAYPNPFTEGFSLILEGDEADAIQLEVFNDSGHPVESISDLSVNTQYRFGASWEPGNYILRINRGGVITSQKVIKK